jgi:hypothetical protein
LTFSKNLDARLSSLSRVFKVLNVFEIKGLRTSNWWRIDEVAVDIGHGNGKHYANSARFLH